MARWIFKLMTVATVAVMPLAAQAQGLRCGERGKVVSLLEEQFKEKQQGFGVVGSRAVIELFVSPEGTWSLLMSRTDRQTCIIAAGHEWDTVPVLLGNEVAFNAR